MKICIECQFCQGVTQIAPNGQEQQFLACTSPDCRDPVNGDPVPCNFARRESTFCSITGKYWKEKQIIQVAPVLELIKG